ncbi:CAD domain protein [Escherichia coli 2-222-05_S3_C2]|nr:CAD domain protein [Escherichia coli 2-222-05_S3_C3]KEN92797.1 CAD domain protein [Escherichia coli 2-222-05_S3_C1]KEO02650.1 CAD domain protein [Escherichia coli 2-222-05_S3_C2]
MAMDLRDPNVWISHLLENLPEEKLASALKDDNPNWEYIDGEIVKLGSLAPGAGYPGTPAPGAGHSGFGE